MKYTQLLRLISIINSLLIIPACNAQNPSGTLIEDVLEDISVNNDVSNAVNEYHWEDELEELSVRLHEPVDLNRATRQQLEQFPFLSDIQIEHLLAYVYVHGQMETLYELQLIKDMDRQTIEYLLPFVCIKAINNEPSFRWKSMLKSAAKYGKHELLTRMDIPFYKRKGYEHTYLGPSVYNSVRYSFRYRDQLYAGVVAEKDAGEPLFALHDRRGYDYYSFYLLLKDCGRLKTLAVGNYRLSFGQGLVISTDYLMGKTVYATSFYPRSGGIKKHSSTAEANYFRGAAATISLSELCTFSGFYSYRMLDGVVTDGSITSIYKTGLHRSQKEADKKNLFAMQLTGGNVTFQQNRISLGITGIYYLFNRAYEPLLTGYSKYNIHGNRFYNLGMDYSFRLHRFSIQGEMATGKQGWASMNRFQYSPVEGTQLMLIHRYYSYDYWAMFARSFGEGSSVQNEQGVYLGIETAPFRRWHFFASFDLFSFPWKKYRISKPSKGVDGLIQATFKPRANLTMELKYRYKQKERDLPGSKISGNSVVGNSMTGNTVIGNTVVGNSISGNTVIGNTVAGNLMTGNSVTSILRTESSLTESPFIGTYVNESFVTDIPRTENSRVESPSTVTSITRATVTENKEKTTLPIFHHQLRFRLNYSLNDVLSTRTTIDYNHFHSQDRAATKGYQVTQRISSQLPWTRLFADVQGSYFSTDDYDSRVYVSEKGLLYTFYTPSFQGRGYRYAVHLRYDLNEHWMLIAKFGETVYLDRTEIGSGNDLIKGNKKADLQMQLRIKF